MLGYFQNFPRVVYDLNGNPATIDYNLVTNIMTRVSFIKDLQLRTDIYYDYIIKDTDTPENIADRYYGDPNYFWVILLFNNIMDPQFDWPLNSRSLDAKIRDTYGDALNDIHHYEMNVETYDVFSQTTTNFTYIIDQETFNNTPVFANEHIDDGMISVSVTTTTSSVSNYDYEVDQNEQKRSIHIVKSNYLGQIQGQLEKALSS
jgi:hypothetical protein